MKILKITLITLCILVGLLGVATLLFVQQASFGQQPEGERLSKIEQSPNYRDGHFQNLEPTEVMTQDASYWKLLQLQFSAGENRSPSKQLPSIKQALGGHIYDRVKVTWFGHSTILLQLDNKNLLFDPVFSKYASPVQYAGSAAYEGTDIYSIDDLPPLDFVMISHDHYDHLDYESILRLVPKTGKFYVPLGVGSHFEEWGVPTDKVVEMDWWQQATLADSMQLVMTPARHFSGRSLTDRGKTLWASYVVKTADYSIYFSGDSGYGMHFKQIGDKYGPFDLAMMETGQYHEFWPNIHMMPEQTVQAHIDLKGKALLPIHWGKFTLALHDWTDPVERLSAQAEKQRIPVVTPIVGEMVVIDSLVPQRKWWRTTDL